MKRSQVHKRLAKLWRRKIFIGGLERLTRDWIWTEYCSCVFISYDRPIHKRENQWKTDLTVHDSTKCKRILFGLQRGQDELLRNAQWARGAGCARIIDISVKSERKSLSFGSQGFFGSLNSNLMSVLFKNYKKSMLWGFELIQWWLLFSSNRTGIRNHFNAGETFKNRIENLKVTKKSLENDPRLFQLEEWRTRIFTEERFIC